MNWLAHAFLSDTDPEFRLGNMLADVVKGRDLAAMPPAFQRGAACHRAIDAFTDAHPVHRRSRARVSPAWRRFSGILVDVFYDHFLAANWGTYAREPLPAFTSAVYISLARYEPLLPEHARPVARVMAAQDHLGAYARVAGVEAALWRISRRLNMRTGRSIALDAATSELTANYESLAQDFREFFPPLTAHARSHFAGVSAILPHCNIL